MSLPETTKMSATRLLRAAALSGLVAAAALISACTVRPLYSNAPLSAGSEVASAAELASIAIKPVNSRYAQQVRNNLIFALTGGSGQPAAPVYSLDLGVTEAVQSAASIQVSANEDVPTAGTVTLSAKYLLTDAKTGERVASGTRSITSSYDISTQQFAAYRALRDAEDRAARELADLLRLAIAQDLAKR
jgi:LPS-assembly lipoprotein